MIEEKIIHKIIKEICEEENIEFNDGDLFNALHGATLKVSGVKDNNKWKLDITITDPYDFTELTKLQDYMGKEHKINKIPTITDIIAIDKDIVEDL